MNLILTVFLLFINPDIIQVQRVKPNTVRNIYLCDTEELNCQVIIKWLISHAEHSIKIQNGPIENDMIKHAIHGAVEKNISIQMIVNKNSDYSIDFAVGNRIPVWVDAERLKRFIIIDDQIVITGPFNFTGHDGDNQEIIEIDHGKLVSSIYLNEFSKHQSHSLKIEVDAL